MTFKETDFPSIINYLRGFVKEDTDPVLAKDVVLQVIKMYDEVPLYPGIVSSCLYGVLKNLDPKQLSVGQKIHVRAGDRIHCGTVSAVTDKGISLSKVQTVASESEVRLDFGQINGVQQVNEKVLAEKWPSLVFEK
jgi:hypothetical protein